MAKTLKDIEKKEKTKKYLKWNLYLFILVFVLSILILLEEHDLKTIKNPLIDSVKANCYNVNEILNYSFIEGNRYNLIKSNLKDGKYKCTVLDATSNNTGKEVDYSIFNTVNEDNN